MLLCYYRCFKNGRRTSVLADTTVISHRLLAHIIQTRLLDPELLPPLLRTIRAALFPNNAPGSSSLVAPSSDEELNALRRRCASAIWALVPKGAGKLYFGSGGPLWSSSSGNQQAKDSSSCADIATPSGSDISANAPRFVPLGDTDNKSGPSNHSAEGKTIAASTEDDAETSGPGRLPRTGNSRGEGEDVTFSKSAKQQGPSSVPPSPTTGTVTKSDAEESTPLLHNASAHAEDDRILSEIETGILDLFSDPYCNKHFMYGALELILVRLMPELAEKGVIELWEERLS
jgi:hypothetical protein